MYHSPWSVGHSGERQKKIRLILAERSVKIKSRIKAQRSGFDSERRRSEMSELWPKAEAKDMELASTKLVLIAVRVHPFPFRTRQLSSLAPKILGW